jgi:hypothetical protein
VRCTFFEHRQHRAHNGARRANFDAIRVNMPGAGRKKLAEKLVGAVDEMNLHAATSIGVCDARHRFSISCQKAPKSVTVNANPALHMSGADRAALAYSVLTSRCADEMSRRLSMAERARLREGLSRVKLASDDDRMAAIQALVQAVRKGVTFPSPRAHDASSCPFTVVESHPRGRVIEVLERAAAREPVIAAVTLCHLSRPIRDELWSSLTPEAKSAIFGELDAVPDISNARTRIYARDIMSRLGRAIRTSSITPIVRLR